MFSLWGKYLPYRAIVCVRTGVNLCIRMQFCVCGRNLCVRVHLLIVGELQLGIMELVCMLEDTSGCCVVRLNLWLDIF